MPAPAPAPSPSRSIVWPGLVAAMGLVALLVAFPPFRVVAKKSAEQTTAGDAAIAFDPVSFVAGWWHDQLLPAAGRAPGAGPLLADLRRDPAVAAQRHAHRVGLGNATYYFVRGSGRVTAVERSRLLVEIDGAVVAVRTGPVFGNVVRDGCGLLEVNQVPGLAEFNALSGEINRVIEERVQPPLKAGVAVGATLSFAGCVEAPESLPPSGPLLTFIPIVAEVTP